MKEILIAPHFLNIEPVPQQSNLYKAERADGTVSAVQVFPFNISDDANELLQQEIIILNESIAGYNVAIPKILSNQLTQTGSYPYIEMEWIEGKSIDDILKESGATVFTIEETLKLAEQISASLAHLHNLGLSHGNIIKSSIKWDNRKKRYFLLNFDFQLKPGTPNNVYLQKPKPAIVTEQENKTLPVTDVQAFGLLVFQLLTGCNYVPLKEDIISIRENALPKHWNEVKKEEEKNIPAWLLAIINNCLNKNEIFFENSTVLYHSILINHKEPLKKKDWYRSMPQQNINAKPSVRKIIKAARVQTPPNSAIKKGAGKKEQVMLNRFFIGIIIITAVFAGFSFQLQKKESAAKEEMITANNSQDSTMVEEAYINDTVEQNKYEAKPIKLEKEKNVTAKPIGKSKQENIIQLENQENRSPLKGVASLGK